MKSYNQLARIAYAAYLQSAINQRAANPNIWVKPQPDWCGLNPQMQACWIEAVKAVVHEVQAIH